jgi:diguanylate cyclase (GGDEF)-like protein/PAS domain S-box-containing protein
MPHEQRGSARARADQLFEAAPEALVVVRDGDVRLANRQAIELVGRDPAGTPIRTAIAGWPDDPGPRFEGILRRRGGDLPVEVRVAHAADGALVASIRDARMLIVGRDAEIALVDAELKYRGLVETIPAVVYADDGEVTTYVNPQIERILGVSAEAYRADPDMWLRLVHPDDRERVRVESEAFLAGQGGDLADYRMVRPDGRIVWVRDRAYAHRDDEGRVVWEQGILFDVTELKDAEARIAHLAFHDGLTGLANRQLFEETAELALERAKRDRTVVAILFLDLDDFKRVNDTFGHHSGDRLLVEVAERLRACVRGTDLVARQGGDEFLLLLADLEPQDALASVAAVADRVGLALAQPLDLLGRRVSARGSIGISLYPQDACDVQQLLKTADHAMYRTKRERPGGYGSFADLSVPFGRR